VIFYDKIGPYFENALESCRKCGMHRCPFGASLSRPRFSADPEPWVRLFVRLVRRLPGPIRKVIGDLSDTERVLVGLDIRESKANKN
jgi:hypothetical protein